VLVTAEGRSLVWNSRFRVWSTWTGQAAVAATAWRGYLAILGSDGTARVEVAGRYFDDTSTAIAMLVECGWIELVNSRVYKCEVIGDAVSTTTVSTTVSRNWDSSTASTKSLAVTAGTKPPIVHAPDSGRAESVQLLIQESSTTEGFRLSKVNLEVGVRPGLSKQRSGSYAT
jgi:hypothetical protein